MSSTSTAKAGRLPFPRLFGFSFGSIPAYMLLAMTGVYIPPFYAGKLGVSLTVLGATIGLIRLTDLGIDLLLGWLMDKTKTPIGRYRPWYIAGLPVLWIATYKVFNPPADVTTSYLFVWYIVLYVAYSMIVLAHAAWAAAISADYHDRSRIFGWMLGLAVVGSSLLQATPLLTNGRIRPADPASIPTLGWIIMIASAFCVLITVLSAPERQNAVPKVKASLKDYFAVFTNPSMVRLFFADLFLVLGPGASAPIYVFFFHDAKGFALGLVSILLIPYTGAGIVGAPFWARVAQKVGKHRTVQLCGIGYALTQTVLMAIPAKLFWPTFVSMFSVGFCLAGFVVLIRAMVADVADELRLETGQERSGVLYAIVTLTQKLGGSLAVTITYPILDMVGYVGKPGFKNSAEAIHGLSMTYVFAPILLVVIGAACLIGYKLDAKRTTEIRTALDEIAARDYAASLEGLGAPGENIAARAS